jgi:hypothetical protein
MKDIYVLYFFIALATITFICLSIIFFTELKKMFNKFKTKFKVFLNNKKNKLILKLCRYYTGTNIDFIFNSFVHFYENDYKKIEDIYETNIEDFPNGKVDILNTYRYITKYRIDNIEDYKNLVINDKIEIFGSHFINYNFKVDEQKRVHIHPSNNGNVIMTQMKHQNMLYELDNETCKWILDKRKHFNI